MGYIRHNTIVLVSYSNHILKAHKEAKKIFNWVSPISPEAINGYRSFFIPPDGSKEGWNDLKLGDNRRKKFIDWCSNEKNFYCDLVDISFGGDGDEATLEREL